MHFSRIKTLTHQVCMDYSCTTGIPILDALAQKGDKGPNTVNCFSLSSC